MARLREEHGPIVFDQILASKFIPPLEDSGLLLDDFDYFLAIRLDLIVNKINELAGASVTAARESRSNQ
jgi:hypothetical protein